MKRLARNPEPDPSLELLFYPSRLTRDSMHAHAAERQSGRAERKRMRASGATEQGETRTRGPSPAAQAQQAGAPDLEVCISPSLHRSAPPASDGRPAPLPPTAVLAACRRGAPDGEASDAGAETPRQTARTA